MILKSPGKDKNGVEFLMNDIILLERATRKINHWQYENEYRYIISLFIAIHGSDRVIDGLPEINEKFAFPNYIDIPLKRQLEEVVLGPNMDCTNEKMIRDFLHKNGITRVKKSAVRKSR